MKIKKGEVYMFKKSRNWVRVLGIENGLYAKLAHLSFSDKKDKKLYLASIEWWLGMEIKKGNLIKIPQLYK